MCLTSVTFKWLFMEPLLYKGKHIEPNVHKLSDGTYSVAVNVLSDEGDSVGIQEYYTENTALSLEEALRRAYSLGKSAIDQLEMG